MSFRTPSTTQQRQTLLDLERTKERIALNQSRIASGKRITRPGDDPTASALILDFGNSIEANTQFLKQADSGLSFLKSSENAVATAINDATRLIELAQQGLNSTNAGSGRAAMAKEVDAIRSNLLSIANTREQGKYLFAGTRTQTMPFVDPGSGATTYSGDSGVIALDLAPADPVTGLSTNQVATNVAGNAVFYIPDATSAAVPPPTVDLFQVAAQLRDALTADSAAGIQSAFTNLQAFVGKLTQVQTDLGGRQAGLLDLQDTLSNVNVTLQGLQNAQQDTNYAQSVSEFSSDQTVQSATLSTLAKSSKTNLFDYIG